jgi:hypothetical protein
MVTKTKEINQEVIVEKKKAKSTNKNKIANIGTELEANIVVNTKTD